MSQLKVNSISDSAGANGNAITLATDGTCTAKITNRSNRNLIINGSQDIDQRNSGTEVNPVVHEKFVTDRFKFDLSQASKLKAQQVSDGPTGFTKSLKVTSLAATAPGASDYYLLQQNIEGLNSAQLGWGASGAKTVTLSFWVKSSLTGTFGAALRNSAHDRTNVQTYAISAADTWEKKTITFTGDTSGTWLTTNGIGLRVGWDLGAGTDFDAASTGSWLATNDFTTSSCTHVVATNAATWQITGLQLEVGSTATDFEYSSYSDEVQRCRRYYQHFEAGDSCGLLGFCDSSTALKAMAYFHPHMRSTPSLKIDAVGDYKVRHSGGSATTATAFAIGSSLEANYSMARLNITVGSGLTAGQCAWIGGDSNKSPKIDFSAEL